MKNQKKIEETNKKWVEARCKHLVKENLPDFERAIVEEWSEPQLATVA